jgi:hypothetical protein
MFLYFPKGESTLPQWLNLDLVTQIIVNEAGAELHFSNSAIQLNKEQFRFLQTYLASQNTIRLPNYSLNGGQCATGIY